MVSYNGKSSQKLARQNTLVNAIYKFVNANPGVGSAAISGHLSADRKIRNAGLTSRKIGYFIPRHCKDKIRFEEKNEGRVYFPIEKKKDINKEEGLEAILDD